MRITPNQWTILETLEKKGPVWARSMQTVKPLVVDLVDKGLVERCRPFLGRGKNMLKLSRAGEEMLGLGRFSEQLADGASPTKAAIRSGHAASFGAVLLERVCKLFGPQAR